MNDKNALISRDELINLLAYATVKCSNCSRPATIGITYRYESDNGVATNEKPCCPDSTCEQYIKSRIDGSNVRVVNAPYAAVLTRILATLEPDELASIDVSDSWWMG